jgi:hypothetical protein
MLPVDRRTQRELLDEQLDDAMAGVGRVGRIAPHSRQTGSYDPPIPKAVAIGVIVFVLLIVTIIAVAIIPVMIR